MTTDHANHPGHSEHSDHSEQDPGGQDLPRRRVLQTAAPAVSAVLVGPAGPVALASPAPAQGAASISPAARNKGPLGARLQGVQHFGVTVQNMDRAFAFYTEVLGGTEVMRD